jgi:hypothetical protein
MKTNRASQEKRLETKMSDDFYRAFDRDYLRNESNPERKQDYRSVFHQDRDRLMFTSPSAVCRPRRRSFRRASTIFTGRG